MGGESIVRTLGKGPECEEPDYCLLVFEGRREGGDEPDKKDGNKMNKLFIPKE